MDEIREYEEQLIAVREALKEEPSEELKEVEAELLSLLAELRKNLSDTPERPLDQPAKASKVEGKQGSDSVGNDHNVQNDADHNRKGGSDEIRGEANGSGKHNKEEHGEKPDGHIAENPQQEPSDKLDTQPAYTNKASPSAGIAQEHLHAQSVQDTQSSDGPKEHCSPHNSLNHNGQPPNPVKDDYELGRAKWKTFSGRITKRKKHK